MPIAPDDPRLHKCGFVKLQGEDLEVYCKKYEIIIGRRSKSTALDVVLGDNMNISRQHAIIRYNFDTKAWELIVQGKNGVTVNGNLFTPQSQPATLHSQDLMEIGDRSFYFLLPRAPHKKARRRAPLAQPPQAAAAAAGTGAPLHLTALQHSNAPVLTHRQNGQQQQYQGGGYTPTPEAGTPYSEAGQTPGYSEPPDNGYTPGYQQQQHQAGDREQHGYSQQEEEGGEEGYEEGDEQQGDYGDEDDQDDGGYPDQGDDMDQDQGGQVYNGGGGQQLQQGYPYSNGGGMFR